MLGNAYEYLIKQFADATNKKAGEFYTPRSVVRLMVDILDPKEGETIYDPACGTGGILLAAVAHVRERGGDPRTFFGKLYGQEKNLTTAAVGRMNLFLHGIEDFVVERGDTLRNPVFTDPSTGGLGTFDVVLANPPFSLEQWGRDLWAADPWGRPFAGLPTDSNGDMAWVQHMVKSMAARTGRMTGFDAPILQAMYLDKPLRDHSLVQAICRTNRLYGDRKTHGVIVDYLGVFDDVPKALEFDEQGFRKVVDDIAALKDKVPAAMQKCLAFFPGVDRTQDGYEGLMAAQECLPNNTVRDAFAAEYSVLGKIWEAVSPDPSLAAFNADYRWMSQVYVSVQPTTGTGRLIWHALGAKTIELIHQNVHVDAVHDDLETLVVDAGLLDKIIASPEPKKGTKLLELKLTARLRKHLGNPKYRALSERLEALKERHERGLLNSIEFLKQLLELAHDLVATEKETPPAEDEDRGKAALTELFQQVKNDKTPVVVERIVADIDGIVRLVRFPGWQQTAAGEREVKKALRKSLLKYQLHQDTELFDKAYGYVRQYY